ncbi:MAG: hypothetical protein ACXABY_06875 [Candidatus Thorarchaeota archaeon]|jgi:hypothetical protein
MTTKKVTKKVDRKALKPCPLCGAPEKDLGFSATIYRSHTKNKSWGTKKYGYRITCWVCLIKSDECFTEGDAIRHWNRRDWAPSS